MMDTDPARPRRASPTRRCRATTRSPTRRGSASPRATASSPIYSHTHCFANHILAQNIALPAVLLEYPRWEDFTAEVDRGYPIIGISAFPVHLDTVMQDVPLHPPALPGPQDPARLLRRPGLPASYDLATQQQYVDHVVPRRGGAVPAPALGEPADRPMRQALMPKAGGSLPFLSQVPEAGRWASWSRGWAASAAATSARPPPCSTAADPDALAGGAGGAHRTSTTSTSPA